MSYPTRRARLEAEKQARRSHRRRSLTMGAVGLTTVVGATVAGMGPAAANESAYSATSGSTANTWSWDCLLYTSPSPRDLSTSRMPSSA